MKKYGSDRVKLILVVLFDHFEIVQYIVMIHEHRCTNTLGGPIVSERSIRIG